MTTKHFLSAFGFETLRDLPDVEMLEDAELMQRRRTDVALPFEGMDNTDTDEA